MDRTFGADNIDIGGGKRGFKDENTVAGTSGTVLDAAFMNSLQEEILAVIEDADITPNKDTWTQLLEAITAKINASRVYLPIFPEIKTTDGKMPVTAVSPGLIHVEANTDFIIRGTKKYTTALVPLVTAASKTYHLRWNATDGFVLKDLSNAGYNPTAVAETNSGFDSTYDDMLVARIVTDGANVGTVTTLVNKPALLTQVVENQALNSALDWTTLTSSAVTLNWARTPVFSQPVWQEFRSFNLEPNGAEHTVGGIIRACGIKPSAATSRYGAPNLIYWYEDSTLNDGYLAFVWNFQA
jgi:hypothetical protein